MYPARDLQRVDVLPKMFPESNQNKWRKFLENILIILTKSQELILQCCFLIVLKYFYAGGLEGGWVWVFNLEQNFYRTAFIKCFHILLWNRFAYYYKFWAWCESGTRTLGPETSGLCDLGRCDLGLGTLLKV